MKLCFCFTIHFPPLNEKEEEQEVKKKKNFGTCQKKPSNPWNKCLTKDLLTNKQKIAGLPCPPNYNLIRYNSTICDIQWRFFLFDFLPSHIILIVVAMMCYYSSYFWLRGLLVITMVRKLLLFLQSRRSLTFKVIQRMGSTCSEGC